MKINVFILLFTVLAAAGSFAEAQVHVGFNFSDWNTPVPQIPGSVVKGSTAAKIIVVVPPADIPAIAIPATERVQFTSLSPASATAPVVPAPQMPVVTDAYPGLPDLPLPPAPDAPAINQSAPADRPGADTDLPVPPTPDMPEAPKVPEVPIGNFSKVVVRLPATPALAMQPVPVVIENNTFPFNEWSIPALPLITNEFTIPIATAAPVVKTTVKAVRRVTRHKRVVKKFKKVK